MFGLRAPSTVIFFMTKLHEVRTISAAGVFSYINKSTPHLVYNRNVILQRNYNHKLGNTISTAGAFSKNKLMNKQSFCYLKSYFYPEIINDVSGIPPQLLLTNNVRNIMLFMQSLILYK